MLSDTRRKGLFQLVWATTLFLVLAGIGYWLTSIGWPHIPWEFAIPAGFALAGLVQTITGIHFSELSSRWSALKAWQRGVFGISLIVAILGFFFAGVAAYAWYQGV